MAKLPSNKDLADYHRQVRRKAMMLAQAAHRHFRQDQPDRFPEWETIPASEQELFIRAMASLIYDGLIPYDN